MCFLFSFYFKGKFTVCIVETIFLHWFCSPTVNASQTILALLDVKLNKSFFYQVATMLSPSMLSLDARIQIFYQVWNGAALHGGVAFEGQSLASSGIEDREIADVGMVTALLWTNVWIILLSAV